MTLLFRWFVDLGRDRGGGVRGQCGGKAQSRNSLTVGVFADRGREEGTRGFSGKVSVNDSCIHYRSACVLKSLS